MRHLRLAPLIVCLLTGSPVRLWAEAIPAQPGMIVLEGHSLPFLHQYPLSQIRIFAFRPPVLTFVPFQIDERDRCGRWVIKVGPRPSQDDQPGRFDPNDAIIFLRRDMGKRAPAAVFPAGRWHEARLGSNEIPLGFVYIRVGVQSAQPIRSGLVRYDPQHHHIYAEGYSVAFDTPLPSHLAFVDSPGDLGQNLISHISVDAEVSFLGGLLKIRRTDKDLHARLYGYTQGPVRVIRRALLVSPPPLASARGGGLISSFIQTLSRARPWSSSRFRHVLFWPTARSAPISISSILARPGCYRQTSCPWGKNSLRVGRPYSSPRARPSYWSCGSKADCSSLSNGPIFPTPGHRTAGSRLLGFIFPTSRGWPRAHIDSQPSAYDWRRPTRRLFDPLPPSSCRPHP